MAVMMDCAQHSRRSTHLQYHQSCPISLPRMPSHCRDNSSANARPRCGGRCALIGTGLWAEECWLATADALAGHGLDNPHEEWTNKRLASSGTMRSQGSWLWQAHNQLQRYVHQSAMKKTWTTIVIAFIVKVENTRAGYLALVLGLSCAAGICLWHGRGKQVMCIVCNGTTKLCWHNSLSCICL